jgi:hypothetical protein
MRGGEGSEQGKKKEVGESERTSSLVYQYKFSFSPISISSESSWKPGVQTNECMKWQARGEVVESPLNDVLIVIESNPKHGSHFQRKISYQLVMGGTGMSYKSVSEDGKSEWTRCVCVLAFRGEREGEMREEKTGMENRNEPGTDVAYERVR